MERVKHTGRNGTGGENSAGDIGGEGGGGDTAVCGLLLHWTQLNRSASFCGIYRSAGRPASVVRLELSTHNGVWCSNLRIVGCGYFLHNGKSYADADVGVSNVSRI